MDIEQWRCEENNEEWEYTRIDIAMGQWHISIYVGVSLFEIRLCTVDECQYVSYFSIFLGAELHGSHNSRNGYWIMLVDDIIVAVFLLSVLCRWKIQLVCVCVRETGCWWKTSTEKIDSMTYRRINNIINCQMKMMHAKETQWKTHKIRATTNDKHFSWANQRPRARIVLFYTYTYTLLLGLRRRGDYLVNCCIKYIILASTAIDFPIFIRFHFVFAFFFFLALTCSTHTVVCSVAAHPLTLSSPKNRTIHSFQPIEIDVVFRFLL